MASSSSADGPDGDDGPLIDITIKTLDGQNRSFNVAEKLTVRQFKEKISGTIEIPADTQRLIFQGRVMQDEKSLKDYDVHSKVIHLVQRAPPTSLTGTGTTESGPERPRSRHHHVHEGNLLDVQIHVGRVQGNASSRGARSRMRQAEFNLGLVNDALDLLEQRTNLPGAQSDDDPAAAERSEGDGGELMDTNESSTEPPGSAQPQTTTQPQTTAQTTAQPQGSTQPQATAQPQANAQPQAEGADQQPTDATSGLTALELADFMDRVLTSNDRMTPHMRLYRNYLRNEETHAADSQESRMAQEVLNRVSEAMHAMSHLMHSLSDIMVDMGTDPPRQATANQPASIHIPGTNTMAIPIQMNVRARRDGRPRAQPVVSTATSTSTPTAGAQDTGSTTTSTMSSNGEASRSGTTTASGTQPEPAHQSGAAVNSLPGMMQATVDFTQAFRLPAGDVAPTMPPGADPSLMMVVVNDVQTVDGQTGPVNVTMMSSGNTVHGTSATDTPPATSTPAPDTTAPATPTATTSSPTPPSTQPQVTTSGSRPARNVFSEMFSMPGGGATQINFNPFMNPSMHGAPRPGPQAPTQQNIPNLPNVPGMPPGMLQNILGSVLAQHGVQPGQPVRMNIVQQSGPTPMGASTMGGPPPYYMNLRPPEPQTNMTDIQVEVETSTMTDIPASHTDLRSNATAGGPATTSTTDSNAGRSASATSSTHAATNTNATHASFSMGTNTDPSPNTNHRSTNTGQSRPHVHIHRAGAPGGIRGQGPVGPIPLLTPGNGRGGYTDPFLPCSSHHYFSESARRALRAQQSQQNNTGVPNLSTMVSGLVGDIIDQVSTAFTNGGSAGNRPPTTAAPTMAAPTTTYTSIRPPSGVRPEAPPPPTVNPMQMLAGLMGQRPAGGVATGGFDIGSLISRVVTPIMQGHPPAGATGQTPPSTTLADLFSIFRDSAGSSDQEAGLLVSLLESMAQHVQMTDLLSLIMGNAAVLGRLRGPLHQFVQERITQHGSVEALVQISLDDIMPHLQQIQGLVTVREGVDMVQSLRQCLQAHLRLLLSLIHTNAPGNNDDYGRQLYDLWMTMMAELIATCIYCIQDGEAGFSNMLQAYMPQMTEGLNPDMTGWMVNSLQEILSSFHRNHPVAEASILKFVVKKQPDSRSGAGDKAAPCPGSSQTADRRSSSEPPTPQPMEVNASPSSQPPRAKVPKTEDSEDIFVDAPESFSRPVPRGKPTSLPTAGASAQPALTPATDNSWQTVIPQEWIPVINQDTVRQQSQRPQPPYSDAYLQGLPAKRRRMMGRDHAGEMGNMSTYLPASLARAARRAGVEPISSEENLLTEARDNAELQVELEREVCQVLESRASTDEDFNSDRFPNSQNYFRKSPRH